MVGAEVGVLPSNVGLDFPRCLLPIDNPGKHNESLAATQWIANMHHAAKQCAYHMAVLGCFESLQTTHSLFDTKERVDRHPGRPQSILSQQNLQTSRSLLLLRKDARVSPQVSATLHLRAAPL